MTRDNPQQSSPAHASTPAHRRRWLQFRLKWLLVFIAILAVPLSWLGWKLEEKRRERWAEAELNKFHILMSHNYPDDGDPFGEVVPPGPWWVRRLLGDDFFLHVESVDSWPYPDIDLDELSGPAQEEMREEPPLNDVGLTYLPYLPNLRSLDLTNCDVTDAGLVHLQKLRTLEALILTGTKISTAGIAALQKAIPQCRILHESQPK